MQENEELARLLAAAADGDRAAFRRAYDIAGPRLYRASFRILGRRDLAEEALQDAFLNIWDKAATFDPARGSAIAWMATITRRRAIDRLRASPWMQRETEELDERSASANEPSIGIAIRECFERLRPEARYAIKMAYFYGMTHGELARKTKTPLGTVKSLIRRGLIALKECLDE